MTTAWDSMEGAIVSLNRVDAAGLPTMHEHFQKEQFWFAGGYQKPPSIPDIQNDLIEQDLVIWEMRPLNNPNQLLGYAGTGNMTWPSVLFFETIDGDADIDIAQDCLPLIIEAFFAVSDRPEIYLHVNRNMSDEAHPLLIESGFDPTEEVPDIDPKQYASYVIKRETWEIYFGEGEESAYEELDF
ncbi:hypothetical protein KAI87_10070 [Myxococcota bacterium]|nr:hypothetical protein [Myxococcota bacterium]